MDSLVVFILHETKRIWELRDKRMDGWPLMDSPIPALILSSSYLYFVKVLGPRLMDSRPPFELRGFLLAYNFFQIFFNAWIFYEIGMSSGWFDGTVDIFCQPIDYSENETALRLLRAGYWFYISKFIDFLDTIFFVLRKKTKQVSVLHVVHHSIMPVSLWPGMRYACGGHASFFALLNSLIHVIMYFYYFLAAAGPRFERFLWWKKYLTTCQMIQFVLASVHCFQLIFKNECGFPVAFYWWIGLHELLFLSLFLGFYKGAYNRKRTHYKTG